VQQQGSLDPNPGHPPERRCFVGTLLRIVGGLAGVVFIIGLLVIIGILVLIF